MRLLSLITVLIIGPVVFAQPTTQPAAGARNDDLVVTPMRVQQTAPATFFYKEIETTIDKIGQEAPPAIVAMIAAMKEAGNEHAGPVTFVYQGVTHDMAKPFKLQIGILTNAEAKESGEFKVRKLDAIKCASVIFGGSYAHMQKVYEQLFSQIFPAGLQPTDEVRESYLLYEGPESPNNVTLIQAKLQE